MNELQELLERHQGHALIADCEDWDNLITPALVAFGDMEPTLMQLGGMARERMLRVMFEVIYQLGYERGKESRELVLCIRESSDQSPSV